MTESRKIRELKYTISKYILSSIGIQIAHQSSTSLFLLASYTDRYIYPSYSQAVEFDLAGQKVLDSK